jgi:hypothetical protein
VIERAGCSWCNEDEKTFVARGSYADSAVFGQAR